ncbi:hypothetical protein SXY01_02660 [Staphylococcus xylosus]|nr:hypothetical protein SXY01_02660 [Staphylococcus xylosus]
MVCFLTLTLFPDMKRPPEYNIYLISKNFIDKISKIYSKHCIVYTLSVINIQTNTYFSIHSTFIMSYNFF